MRKWKPSGELCVTKLVSEPRCETKLCCIHTISQFLLAKSSDSKDMKYEDASKTAGKSVNWYNLSKSILTFSVKNLTIYPTETEHILTYIQGQ